MDINKYFPKLIRAALDKDDKAIRSISMILIRRFREVDNSISAEIVKALDYDAIGASAKRSLGISKSPTDIDSSEELLTVEEPLKIDRPIYNNNINKFIDEFLNERNNTNKLIEAGIFPTSSILLYGPPGVGKTYLAKYLAGELNIKFATLNLATIVSSYLGKTGQNLKSVLDYAKKEPTLLLLDEFDAVAKKRDDYSDLGELKRIVNVLLKELEEWPYYSIVIAATNHPSLLDKAIWRRFDSELKIENPVKNERIRILDKELKSIEIKNKKDMLKICSELFEDLSADNICKFCDKIKRRSILSEDKIEKIFVDEMLKYHKDSVEFNKKFCKLARINKSYTLNELGEILGKSKSSIQYYLK